MMFLLFLMEAILLVVTYVMMEIMHYRKGHDVYDWTKKIVQWIDKK